VDFKHRVKRELQDYYRKKIKLLPPVKNDPFDISKHKKTALLFYINNKTELDLVRKVVRHARQEHENNCAVIFCSTEENVDIITDRDFFIFNAGHFDYRWRPRQELRQWFEASKFDLLINFCSEDQLESNILYTLINAKFRISNQNPHVCNFSDLTINTKEKHTDMVTFYNLAIDNLKMLNIKRN